MVNDAYVAQPDLLMMAVADSTGDALRDLDRKMLDVELRLVSRTELHSDDKWFVEPYKVYLNLVWLSGEVGTFLAGVRAA